MRIAVINGSPKGKNSISLQSVLYLQKKFPSQEFSIIHAGALVKSLEKNPDPLLEEINRADLLLFVYPVYTFLAPAQLHRVVEILHEHYPQGLKGKSAAQISTSKHFYDVTAHKFIEENCNDLHLSYLKGFSADMDDLCTRQGRLQLQRYWEFVNFLHARQSRNAPSETSKPAETAARPEMEDRNPAAEEENGKQNPPLPYDILIVTDSRNDPALDRMIDNFRQACPSPTRVVNIARFPFKGGCLGCFHCASDGTCIHTDGYPEFLRTRILNASAVIYAYTVRNHSMGSIFKLFDDRQFCNGHRMTTIGMPVGYLVNGDLRNEPNLMMLMEARAEVGRNTLCGIVSKPCFSNSLVLESEKELADRLLYALDHQLNFPQNFFGIGGTKIFRDLIYLMQGLMRADHKFYKKIGLYNDFPQRHRKRIWQGRLIGLLMNNPKLRKKMGGKINEGMLAPYRKALKEED